MKAKTAKTRNTKKSIFAIPTKDPAIPPNPKRAAIKAITRQAIARFNMSSCSFLKESGQANS